MGRLLLTVGKRLGDPRVCLACVLAGEARLGQALRCDRDSLDLKPGVGASGMGRFTIPDRGRKKGVVVDLTQALRAAVDFELNEGYLADLEAEFRAGRRANYPLFPGGKLVRGRARSTAGTHLGRSGANAQFHQLEVLAGIEPEKGRAWYGVRRQATDLGEDVEQDGRVLNKITGHQSDETRRRVYQAKRREKLLAKAAVARTALRALAVEAAEAASAPSPPIASSHWQLSQARKQARRRAAHVREVARRDTARGIVVTVEPTPKPTPGRGTRGKVEEKEQGSSA
jgi:integrase